MNKNKIENYLSILALIGVLCIALSYIFFTLPSKKRLNHRNHSIQSESLNIDLLDFKLLDGEGRVFDARKLKGKPALIYFGFSSCQETCPASLVKLASTAEMLRKYAIDFNAVFITVDPERDTPAIFKKYTSFFDKDIIALSGTTAEIANVTKLFNVYYAKESSSSSYTIKHSSFIYILDEEGKLLKIFSFNQGASDIIDFLRTKFQKHNQTQ